MSDSERSDQIPQPAEGELNPAVALLDDDVWLAYSVGDDEDCAVLRFKNVNELRITKGGHPAKDPTPSARWAMSFGETNIQVSSGEVTVHRSEIDDPTYAVWEVAHEIREKERAAHSLKNFYDSLTGEVDSEQCAADECVSNRIPHSVFCRKHHFEAIMKRPCPYER